jgi:hypothetical protein
MFTFFVPASLPRPSAVKSADEFRSDLLTKFGSHLATVSEADGSRLFGRSPLKSSIGTLEPEISGSAPGELPSQQENSLVLPTLNFTAGYKALHMSTILKQSGTNAEQISHNPITYPPPLLSVDLLTAENTESLAKLFRRKSRMHFAALCLCLFLVGWNDGSTGPLLPALQESYHVLFSRYAETVILSKRWYCFLDRVHCRFLVLCAQLCGTSVKKSYRLLCLIF